MSPIAFKSRIWFIKVEALPPEQPILCCRSRRMSHSATYVWSYGILGRKQRSQSPQKRFLQAAETAVGFELLFSTVTVRKHTNLVGFKTNS